MKREKRQYIQSSEVRAKWECVSCGSAQDSELTNLRIEGGCQGHEPDEYCYCSSAEAVSELRCADCDMPTVLTLMLS